ncbi:MAG: hypothetical protein KC910_33415, partial [Candidatus Eremiobacteraeota bacterium]|nr:hypothetical protein [Candidatus Eremiobacteraeota bacterium]
GPRAALILLLLWLMGQTAMVFHARVHDEPAARVAAEANAELCALHHQARPHADLSRHLPSPELCLSCLLLTHLSMQVASATALHFGPPPARFEPHLDDCEHQDLRPGIQPGRAPPTSLV